MNVRKEDITEASERAMVLTSAVLLGGDDDLIASTLKEILANPDPATTAMTHFLGMTSVAFTAIALLAKAKDITIQEALQEVGLSLVRNRP